MPSNIISFGFHSNVTPDYTHTQLITHEDMARVISLERQVCQNYNCCGVPLADFHALMNHFDMSHVSVVAPNGKRIFPPVKPTSTASPTSRSPPPSPSYSSSASSSSRSSSVESSPSPTTPGTPPHAPLESSISHVSLPYTPYSGLALSFGSTESSPNHPCPYSYDVISAFGPEYDFTKDYACYEKAYAHKLERKRLAEQREQEENQREIERLERELHAATLEPSPTVPESDLTESNGHSSLSLSPSPSFSAPESDPFTDSFVAQPPAEVTAPKKSKVRKDGSATSNGGKVPKPKVKSTAAGVCIGPLSSLGRKREKNFKCPHQGCTKSYLNPNGLKYHLEKGTCKFDDSDNSGSGSSSESSPGSPTEPSLSSMAARDEVISPASLLPSTSASDAPTSTPSSYHPPTGPSPPTTSYGPFPSTMRPHEVYQTIMHSAGLPSTATSSLVVTLGERGSHSLPLQRVQSAPSPVSEQVHPATIVNPAPPNLAAPTARHPATVYSHLGQGQVVFSGAASSSL
ncbi:hypothetical protein FA13DRAFT_1708270 [Coprinellus micaceus]|uniref:C2H2-type domain-containing protein n=1 Tax=Coprinellus micaceus TaxID=71717 RepID=A0A4Y7TH21_COPMI|nr:hypothetical protein FA13DRAFT_1708270 [Coprinellus micaceus]